MVLGSKVLDTCCDNAVTDVPADICGCFDEDIVIANEGRQLFVTLGQFSIIKLERDIQLLMPAYDFCMPDKECAGNPEDPCALFQNFQFPVDEFFPPKESDFTQTNGQNCCSQQQTANNGNSGGCGCGGLSRRR